MDWNKFIFDKLKDVIQENWLIVDIGAHHGTYTDFFRDKLNNTGKIIAFELHPNNYDVLKNNFNQYSNIILENQAISDQNGDIDYYDGVSDYEFNIIGINTNYVKTNKIGTIPTVNLNTYFKNIKIDFIKMDIEGAELLALKGMSEMYANVNHMLIECHLDNDWPEIRDILLNQFNFQCINLYSNEIINNESPRPYQCLCIKKTI